MLPFIFAALLAFIVIMYVLLDGFDLGIGILFPFTYNESERDIMMNAIAPVWDGNGTWLVFGGAMLYSAFPIVYGTLLPILYMPIMLMLIGLIFRGVCFEFRFKATKTKPIWNWCFALSSVVAAFFQGVIIGCFVQGFPVDPTSLTINDTRWLTPFSLLTGVALIFGYGFLGASWMIVKAEKSLQQKMRHYARGFLVLISLFLIFVSIWTPLHSAETLARWYSFPNILLLTPLPLITAASIYYTWKSLGENSDWKPFIGGVIIFLCSYAGIAVSVYPYLIPHQITLWQAAAPDSTLKFLLVGVVIMLPLLLGYTLYAYYIFRGKTEENYHH